MMDARPPRFTAVVAGGRAELGEDLFRHLFGVAAYAHAHFLGEPDAIGVDVDLNDLGLFRPIVDAIAGQRRERIEPRAEREPNLMTPRQAWRAIQAALPREAIISSDIGNNCAIGNAYPSFDEGRKYLAPGLFGPCGYGFPAIVGAKIGNPGTPVVGFAGDGAFGISMNEMTSIGREGWSAITMVIFRNFQWGAEKRNTTLWYDNNFVGTELNRKVNYAKVAEACGFEGVRVDSAEGLSGALRTAVSAQMEGVTTFIEVLLNQELGEPFRRDAMKKPVVVAGVRRDDMRRQSAG